MVSQTRMIFCRPGHPPRLRKPPTNVSFHSRLSSGDRVTTPSPASLRDCTSAHRGIGQRGKIADYRMQSSVASLHFSPLPERPMCLPPLFLSFVSAVTSCIAWRRGEGETLFIFPSPRHPINIFLASCEFLGRREGGEGASH